LLLGVLGINVVAFAEAEDDSAHEAGTFPTAFELATMEEGPRMAALQRLCRESGPAELKTLWEVADNPELYASHYGEFALAVARLAAEKDIPQALEAAAAAHPLKRFVGMAVARSPSGEDSRKALFRLLESPHADVRAAAALALRHWRDPEVKAALEKAADKGATASERACALAALEWRKAADDCPTPPPRRTVTLSEWPPKTPTALEAADMLRVPVSSKVLGNAECAAAVLAALRKGARLHLLCGPAGVEPEVANLLRQAGLPVPGLERRPGLTFVCNWNEAHPLQDYVFDAYQTRIATLSGDFEAAQRVAAEKTRWLVTSDAGFKDWDKATWAAPFCGLGQPAIAILLDAPPTPQRGRVLLDLAGGDLRLWELNGNLKAFLEGPQAVNPVKRSPDHGRTIALTYFDVDESVVTPHVPWGRFLDHGPVSVGFLVSKSMIRTAIEVRQRLDIQPTWLPFGQHGFGAYGDEKRRGPPVMDAGSTLALRSYLEEATGVLLMPGLEVHHPDYEYVYAWNGFSADLRNAILHAVTRGLGLVAFGESFPSPVATEGVPRSQSAGFIAERTDTPPEILRSIPLSEEAARRLVACYSLGKGRIVHIKVNAALGRADFTLGSEFLVPGLKTAFVRVNQSEYVFAACAAALLWASGRAQETEGRIEEKRIVDRFGVRRGPDAPLTGPAIEETRFLDKEGKVTGWRARRVGPAQAATVDVVLAKRLLSPREGLKASLACEEAPGAEAVAEVVDLHRRIVRRKAFPFDSGKGNLEIDGWHPLGRFHDLRVVVQAGGKAVAEQVVPFAVDVKPDDKDLQFWVWGGATYLFPGFRRAGVTGLTPEAHSLPEATGSYEQRQEMTKWAMWEHTLRNGFEIHGGTRFTAGECSLTNDGTRVPCLSDPSFWGPIRDEFAREGDSYRLFGMRWAFTQDEFGLGNKYCTGPCCMAVFRRELARSYGTLDGLNAAWATNFASWNDVLPDDLQTAVRKQHLVSWSRHRAFMDDRVARWQSLTQRIFREHVPGAGVGLSSYTGSSPDGGFDSAKLAQASRLVVRAGSWEYHDLRDLGPPDLVFGHWFSAGYDQGMRSEHSALVETNYDLLEHAGSIYYWYGYGDFQYPFIRPDLTVCGMLRPMAQELAVLRDGIDRLVLGAERLDTDFAVLFSQPSLRTLHALGQMLGGESQVRFQWSQEVRLLEPVFVRGHLVSAADLPLGRLAKERTKLLLLSGAVAVSQEQVAELERFVSEGGCLVSDVLPAAYTEDSASQDQARIARLFGVDGRFTPVRDVKPAPLRAEGESATLAGQVATARPCIADLKSAGGTAHGSVGESIALVEHRTGKGKTLLLNYSLAEALFAVSLRSAHQEGLAKAERAAAEFLANWTGIRPLLRVLHGEPTGTPFPGGDVYAYRYGDLLVVGVLNRSPAEQKVVLALPEPMVVYDLRSSVEAARTAEFSAILPASRAGYFVLSQRALPPLTVNASLSGTGEIDVSVAGEGKPRAVLASVHDPAGKPRPELRQELVFSDRGRLEIPLAASDPPGKWQIHVRDVVTGQKAELEVEVKR
jgi:hypothetical protein